MQNIEIRPGTLADAAIIARFNIALAKESENIDLDSAVARLGVEAVLRDPTKGTYFTARDGDNIVGVLMVTYEWSDWRNGHFWWLQSVYVDPAHRSRGVFKSMFAHVLTEAKKAANVCGLRLYVENHNPAQDVYLRLGLKKTDYAVMEKMTLRTDAI